MRFYFLLITLFSLFCSYGVGVAFDKEAVKKVKQWQNCNNCDLSGAQLEQSEILGIQLKKANLDKANLKGSIFIDISMCPLDHPDMEEASLKKANLKNTDLEEVNLFKANLRGADLSGANLPFADLDGADLRNTNFENANLLRASLVGANIEGANFRDAYLSNAVWVDGTVCRKGSTGVCLPQEKKEAE